MENNEITNERLKYLNLFAGKYSGIMEAKTYLVKKLAYLHLPKKTEYFLTDIHGEHEAFSHVIKNASGQLKIKLKELFSEVLTEEEIKKTSTLIYYPLRKIKMMKEKNEEELIYYKCLPVITSLAKSLADKYTNENIIQKISPYFREIVAEIIFSGDYDDDKNYYIKNLYEEMIKNNIIDDFVVEVSELIQILSVDHLHIVGDIFDRGPGPHNVMNQLMKFHSVDIQFGNHDILWMGAAAGSPICIANVVRVSARYGNLDILEDGYGINLMLLAQLAGEYYAQDPCRVFMPKTEGAFLKERDINIISKMHKAISIIQFKLEGQLASDNPEYSIENRKLLEKINFEKGTVLIKGIEYKMQDMNFPSVDSANPYELTDYEKDVIEKLEKAFLNSELLQRHARYLFSNGSFYKIHNGNLLFHGCIPLDEEGEFAELEFMGHKYKGKSLMDFFEKKAREYYFIGEEAKNNFGTDVMWYLWQGSLSPLFGKGKMATFERYFLQEKETHKEEKNCYYKLNESEELCQKILKEFGLFSDESKIITGHVPVKASKGEEPVKAGGRLFVIDGGFAKAYQKETGLAGYTLVSNSYGFQLIEHQPFESIDQAIRNEEDIISVTRIVEKAERKYIKDTDEGKRIEEEIEDLRDLINAYKKGIINSNNN